MIIIYQDGLLYLKILNGLAQENLPSTTSITQRPRRFGTRLDDAVWTAMAPPMLCPISIIGGGRSPYMASITLPTSLQKEGKKAGNAL